MEEIEGQVNLFDAITSTMTSFLNAITSAVASSINTVIYTVENYGWHLLICAVILAVVYNKYIKSYVEDFRTYRFEREYAAKYHKNPDLLLSHVNAQQKFVDKLQEKYNREAEAREQKIKEKQEKKQQELREKYGATCGVVGGGSSSSSSRGSGNNGNSNSDDKKPSAFKQDYNPLMGAGSGSNYRPPRRSPCGGGGCGR